MSVHDPLATAGSGAAPGCPASRAARRAAAGPARGSAAARRPVRANAKDIFDQRHEQVKELRHQLLHKRLELLLGL